MKRSDLTTAQRRTVDGALASSTKRAEKPITAGFAVAAWERMMKVLCKEGVFKPYPHGGAYELTEHGLTLGRARSNDR
jgi:hypothetical protein